MERHDYALREVGGGHQRDERGHVHDVRDALLHQIGKERLDHAELAHHIHLEGMQGMHGYRESVVHLLDAQVVDGVIVHNAFASHVPASTTRIVEDDGNLLHSAVVQLLVQLLVRLLYLRDESDAYQVYVGAVRDVHHLLDEEVPLLNV